MFLRLHGKEYAVKIIDKSKWKGEHQIIENEVEILRKVHHPNIIKLLDEYDTPKEFYLVMELEVLFFRVNLIEFKDVKLFI